MSERILVTGGAGFVGSHVVVELAKSGYQPVVLDSFANSTPAIRSRLEAVAGTPVPFVHCDIRDTVSLRAAFHDYPISAVVHCAGLKSIAESEARPLAYYDVNVGGALSLIEVMGEAGVATLVFGSSASVYGDQSGLGEDAPVTPRSVHGRTRLVVETLLRDLAAANPNWRIAILRGFNAAGAHPSGMMGEAPRGGASHLVTRLARVAAGESPEFTICGDDWNTPDGTAQRDYVHVADVAEGFLRVLKHLASHSGAVAFNLGSGVPSSVLQVIAAFERACGRPIARVVGPARRGDVATSVAEPSRAATVLGWRATRDLESICADAWRWQKNGGHY